MSKPESARKYAYCNSANTQADKGALLSGHKLHTFRVADQTHIRLYISEPSYKHPCLGFCIAQADSLKIVVAAVASAALALNWPRHLMRLRSRRPDPPTMAEIAREMECKHFAADCLSDMGDTVRPDKPEADWVESQAVRVAQAEA